MAMEQPDSRIISYISDDCVTARVNRNGISPHRHRGEITIMAIEAPTARTRPLANLKLVAMEMERMNGSIEVIHRQLHDRAALCNVRIHIAVDLGIGALCSGAESGEKRWHYLRDVGDVVEA
jgi:hypothetical protein